MKQIEEIEKRVKGNEECIQLLIDSNTWFSKAVDKHSEALKDSGKNFKYFTNQIKDLKGRVEDLEESLATPSPVIDTHPDDYRLKLECIDLVNNLYGGIPALEEAERLFQFLIKEKQNK